MSIPTLAAEDQRRRDLRRMKAGAGALLLVAVAVYAATYLAAEGGRGWVGLVRAAAEAAMVGGLADWFAVTALFRHPLGLPVPHTAIIPTRKDAIGKSLGDFVGENFLSEAVVRSRVRQAQVSGRIGEWLSRPDNARRVSSELAVVVASGIGVLRDEDVRDVIGRAGEQRLRELPIGPVAGGLLGPLVADGAHHGLVDLIVSRTRVWLADNREAVIGLLADQAPEWSPRFLDTRVARALYAELLRIADEAESDPENPLRQSVDRLLAQLARDLREDPATQAQVDRFVDGMLGRAETRQVFGDLVSAVRRLVMQLVEDPDSELRQRATEAISGFGARVGGEAALRSKLDDWLERAVVHVVTTYTGELTRVITDTVERWDGRETTRRIELQIGRDLQFIRINGTVVGALAGMAIYGATVLLT